MRQAEDTRAQTQRRLATPGDSDSAQPKNFLQACLLLLLREAPSHGYALIERLEEMGSRRDRGVVYRTLRFLEREGLVQSAWEDSHSGPAKRSYALTPYGEEMLSAWAESLRSSARMLGEYLERYHKATKGTSEQAR
ncbi:MAG TPA: helix-turn-helix transcriptional regulator [Egibacteraceae bacterium]|jgi:PadR family transcriptional regulator, regulatory protein PadR|nr:helix-turn-helix transcriptional regulator [Egibacteraceae bacterium]